MDERPSTEADLRVNADLMKAVHAHFERVRHVLDSAIHGSLGQAEAEFTKSALLAFDRVRDLEAERERTVAKLGALERRAREQVEAVAELERRFQAEVAERDARIRELEAFQHEWVEKVQQLAELRKRLDALLPPHERALPPP